jgi:hypothetical protein
MNAKEALDKIRELFADAAMTPDPEPAPMKMEAKEYVLEDGTKVMVSELEVGGMVAVVKDDGSSVPAPEGDHKLADGTTITVAENGVITSVAMPAAPAEMPEDMSAKFAEVEAAAASLRGTLKAENDALRAELESMNVKLRGLADVVSALVEMPAAAPLQEPRNAFAATGSTKEDKLKRVAALFDQLKKSK